MANCALLRDALLWCTSCLGFPCKSTPVVSRLTLHFRLGSFKAQIYQATSVWTASTDGSTIDEFIVSSMSDASTL